MIHSNHIAGCHIKNIFDFSYYFNTEFIDQELTGKEVIFL